MANNTIDLKVRYEFDETGESKNNLVVGERHQTEERIYKVIIPTHAHFYTDSVKIVDAANNRLLEVNEYFFEDPSEIIAEITGKSAASAIIITSQQVSREFIIDYQAVGGIYSNAKSVDLIAKLNELNLDNRPVEWANIRNKPSSYPAQGHLHPMWQTYGYEQVIYTLERIRQARLIGDEKRFDTLWTAYSELDTRLTNYVKENVDNIIDLLSRQVRQTATSIGAYTIAETDILVSGLRSELQAHVNATGNVHGLTPDQLDVYTKSVTDNKVSGAINTARSYTDTKIAEVNANINKNQVTLDSLNAYNKQAVDDKDNFLKTTMTTMLSKEFATLNNAWINKLFGVNDTNYAVTANSNTNQNVTNSEVSNFVTRNLPATTVKLSKNVLPISTQPYNQLRWNTDGLYYGNVPEAHYQNIYVDPDEGVDETITVENLRGSRNKPVATIAFALTQGPENVTRIIHIKEGKEHIIGIEVTDFLNGAFVYKTKPSTHAALDKAIVRGGTVTIRPYGEAVDRVAPYIGDSIWRRRVKELIELNTRIKLVGWRLAGTNGRGQYISPEVLRLEVGTHFTISNCKIINETYTSALQQKIFAANLNNTYVTNNSRIERADAINVNLLNCTYTSTDLVYNGPLDTDIHYIALLSGNSIAKPTFNMYWLDPNDDIAYRNINLINGPNPIIGTFFPIIQLVMDIGTLDYAQFKRLFSTSPTWSRNGRGNYFYGMSVIGGRFNQVNTNLIPPTQYRVYANDLILEQSGADMYIIGKQSGTADTIYRRKITTTA